MNDAPVISGNGTIELTAKCDRQPHDLQLDATDVDIGDTIDFIITQLPSYPFVIYEQDSPIDTVPLTLRATENDDYTVDLVYAYDGDKTWTADGASTWTYLVRDGSGATTNEVTVNMRCGSTFCGAGSFFDGDACAECPAGRSASGSGYRTQCDVCPARTFSTGPRGIDLP